MDSTLILNDPHSSWATAKAAAKSLPPGDIVIFSGNISTKDTKQTDPEQLFLERHSVIMGRDVTKTKCRI